MVNLKLILNEGLEDIEILDLGNYATNFAYNPADSGDEGKINSKLLLEVMLNKIDLETYDFKKLQPVWEQIRHLNGTDIRRIEIQKDDKIIYTLTQPVSSILYLVDFLNNITTETIAFELEE